VVSGEATVSSSDVMTAPVLVPEGAALDFLVGKTSLAGVDAALSGVSRVDVPAPYSCESSNIPALNTPAPFAIRVLALLFAFQLVRLALNAQKA
jgi:hypothetical protein